MLRVLPFAAGDFAVLARRPFTDMELAMDEGSALAAGQLYEASGPAFTAWCDDGGEVEALFVGGAQVHHDGYATLWAAWARGAEAYAVFLTKRARHFVRSLNHRRLDAYVGANNPGAAGWCRLLGLSEETRLQAIYPDGGESIVFSRIRED